MANAQSNFECDKLNFVSFNQNSTSLTIGNDHGFKIFSLDSVDTLDQIHQAGSLKSISLVERMYSSNLVAVVSFNMPRKLHVLHIGKGTTIFERSFSNAITGVKMACARMVVLLEDIIYVYDTREMKVLHAIRDTPPNHNSICALSYNPDIALLAYPGSQHIGEVQIFDVTNLQAVAMIQAHNCPLAAMAFNKDANLLATASDKGTVIRVFSVHSGKKVCEFRRGMKRCVSISSLSFSSDAMFLAAASNTETVHIFKLEGVSSSSDTPASISKAPKGETTWIGYFSKVLSASSAYLPVPSQVSDILSQDRAFATVKLPSLSKKNICTLVVIQKLLRVVIASIDGFLYIYNLDTEEGGECTLIRQHKLDISPWGKNLLSDAITIPSTYADAAKVKRTNNNNIKNRMGSTGSSTNYSSDSTPISSSCPKSKQYSESPDGFLHCSVDNDQLPLDDVGEFPPVALAAQ